MGFSAIAVMNNMQQSGQFTRPPTIDYRYASTNRSLFINHAMAVKLQLQFADEK